MSDKTKNLLYLLPDVAYVVELVQGKDEYTYTVKDYLQVNGKFMNENELLEESLKKLVTKIDQKDYDLILPDFLFTNTIVNVKESGEAKVKEQLESKIIPDLQISEETHAIHHFILTEHKSVSRVQLSALEFSVLDPFKKVFGAKSKASIKKVYPLSWTVKSLISLEPSISLVQLGSNVFLALQYIGVDQANFAEVSDVEKLAETVKTLKGAEPSIQSLYLLSNELVEEKLKETLSDTLPIQQLAQPDDDSEMPTYVKQIIEAGARTLVVPDFKLPEFSLDLKPGELLDATEEEAPAKDEVQKEEVTTEETVKPAAEPEPPAELPTPTEIGVSAQEEKALTDNEEKIAKEEEVEPVADGPTEPELAIPEEKPEPPEVDLSQFSAREDEATAETKPAEKEEAVASEAEVVKNEPVIKAEDKSQEEPKTKTREVIKNESGVNNMMKMIFVGLVSFFITVGIGLGIGLGFLTFTNNNGSSPEETPVAEVSPTVAPTITPTPAPEIDRADYTVLVVNATTQAGYAGDVADDLETAGFESVKSGNAKGEYEEGYYVLLAEEDQNLISILEEDTGLTLEFSDEKEIEDSSKNYDIVIVLSATD